MPCGITGQLIEVEISMLPSEKSGLNIIGLTAYDATNCAARIKNSLINNGFNLPENRKILVNLAPAHIKKIGTYFDLAIITGILQVLNVIIIPKAVLKNTVFIGELSIDGSIRPILGSLSIAFDMNSFGKKRLILSKKNEQECSLIKNLEIVGLESLDDLSKYFNQNLFNKYVPPLLNRIDQSAEPKDKLCFSDVKGQQKAKRALQICAAGRHNILMIGSPGSGKTMLSKRLPDIMPPLTYEEILETSKIYSIAGEIKENLVMRRPFRSPHHTSSAAGILGGGHRNIQPGDISLAHNGILFLDELSEFRKSVLDCLRQPLEDNVINIKRTNYQVMMPCNFLLVGATNPCPCGFWGDSIKPCKCSMLVRDHYLRKLSGPLLDRIDIQVSISSLNYKQAHENESSETSESIARKVSNAVGIQIKRQGKLNGILNSREVEKYCYLKGKAEELMLNAFDKLSLTMRSYHKIIKTARTIADLAESEDILDIHLLESLSYRGIDKYIK